MERKEGGLRDVKLNASSGNWEKSIGPTYDSGVDLFILEVL